MAERKHMVEKQTGKCCIIQKKQSKALGTLAIVAECTGFSSSVALVGLSWVKH